MSKVYVNWSVKRTDPKDVLFGLLLEKKTVFSSFASAISFANSLVKNRYGSSEELISKPIIEEKVA